MSAPQISAWPPLPVGVYGHRRVALPFPLQEPGCHLYSRARHGLWHGLRRLGIGAGDEVLAPAFHHGSEIEVLRRLGAACRFYDVDRSLAPSEDELDDLVGRRTRCLYLIHYLGIPQDPERWRRFCQERDLLLVEDAAQSWLARWGDEPVGRQADLAVWCLYKTVGVPDGAALLMADTPSAPPSDGLGVGSLMRRHAAWLAARAPAVARLAPDRAQPYSAERDFALGDPDSGMSRATSLLLERALTADLAERRRANFRLLHDALGERAMPLVEDPPEGSSPLVMPIVSEDKPELLERLRRSGIEALNLWSQPHPELPRDAFPVAQELRDRVVGLPVHQELSAIDLERIAEAVGRTRGRRSPRRIRRLADPDAIATEWNHLAEASGSAFASHEWAMTWWRHFGTGDDRLRVRDVRENDGRLIGVLPLYLWASYPVRIVRFLGHGLGADVGPVCAPAACASMARALRRALAEERAQVLVGDAMAPQPGWPSLLAGRVAQRSASPSIVLDGCDWDQYLAGRSANFRSQVRRRERRLAREHQLSYRFADDPARLDEDLDVLFRLHAERWGGDSAVFRGRREPFHREFARRALTRGWLRLWFLELDGEPAAAWYGFRLGSVESYYQAGRASSWADSSVGFVLLAHTIRAACEDGIGEYRLGPGDGSYKYRFATRDDGVEMVLVGQGPLGRAAVGGGLAIRRFAPLRRTLRERLSPR